MRTLLTLLLLLTGVLGQLGGESLVPPVEDVTLGEGDVTLGEGDVTGGEDDVMLDIGDAKVEEV